MKNQGPRWLKLLAIAMLALPAFAARPASAQANCRTFTETGHQVCGTFLNYWNNNGALAQQGYPITEPMSEVSDTDGKIYTVQYFERAVFEEHPEFAGTQNEVLLQLLGVFFYQARYPGGHPAPGGNPPPPAAPTATPVPAPPPPTQVPAPPSGAQTFTGHGRQATSAFTLKAGFSRWHSVSTNGTDNFIAWLLDSHGNEVDLVANEIGDSDSSVVINIPSNGQYLLNVEFDGDWTITVDQGQSERLLSTQQALSRTFPETGKTVSGTFLAYWTSHGDLRQQGYPISDEFIEVNQLDGKPYKVQYFERAVFEEHPEFAGTPNEVLLSQLGTFQNTRKHSAPTPIPVVPTSVPAQPTPTTAPPPPAATATSAPADPCSGLPAANPNVVTIPVSRCGPAGTAFGWTARGFHPNENVGVYITLPDGGVAGAPFQVSTDDQGYVLDGVTFSTRPGYPLGRYAITFEGVESHITQIEYFQLIP